MNKQAEPKLYSISVKTPLGPLYLCADRQGLTYAGFVKTPGTQSGRKQSPVLAKAALQITRYFSNKPAAFNKIPLSVNCSPFQKRVWKELSRIPFGETVSYGDVAKKIGMPKAARAVGTACRSNPFCLIIPCHRVIGKNKALTGYAGGLSRKRDLLGLEQKRLEKKRNCA